MSRVAAAILLALSLSTSWAAEERTKEEKPRRIVAYHEDRLTLHVAKMPIRDVLNELSRQSGAEIRGEVPEHHAVSADFDDIPLSEALERLLGKQNFALGYGEESRLIRITLLGGPLPPPEKTADATEKAAATPQPPGDHQKPWPPDGDVRRSAETVWRFMDAEKEYPIGGRLAEALHTKRATFRQLAFAAAREQDRRVRGLALMASLNLVESDPEVRDAFFVAMDSLGDEAIAHLARQFAQDRAEEFVTRVAHHTGVTAVRTRMSPVMQHLSTMGPEK